MSTKMRQTVLSISFKVVEGLEEGDEEIVVGGFIESKRANEKEIVTEGHWR
jgi:hypothetical protein